MKKRFILKAILIIVALLLASGCSKKNQKKIIGKWNINEGDEIMIFKPDGFIEGEDKIWELSDKAPFRLKIISLKNSASFEEFIITFVNPSFGKSYLSYCNT